jgi:hypothetical protein
MRLIQFVILCGFISALFFACSSAPRNDRERFEQHWKQQGSDVQVLEVRPDGEVVHGSGIVDQRPVDEFYNPKTGMFTSKAPVQGQIVVDAEETADYKTMLSDLAKESTKILADSDRIAVLDFPDEKGKDTALSKDIAEKIEAGLVDAGKTVVDRAQVDKVMKEHQFQQGEGALFDSATLARLGKFVGANHIIYGKYTLIAGQQLSVSAKVISVETTRLVGSKSKDIPLTGGGAGNLRWIENLLKE